jgi:hypothetical protein
VTARSVWPSSTGLGPALGRNDVRLFLTSATLLFVELVLIRWVPANVTYIGFFTNFILMASFLGIGLGILAGRRWPNAGTAPFAILLASVVALVITAQLNVQLRSPSELVFGIGLSRAADVNALVLPLMFVLVTLTMATLALPLGKLLRSMVPLRAYGVDVAGSLAGIAAFSGLSAAATHPLLWFGVVAVLATLLSLGQKVTITTLVVPLAMAATVLMVGGNFRGGDTWSPYYRISTYVSSCDLINVNVNGIPHQALHPVVDLKATCAREPFYEQVYRWFPAQRFSNVLVVGAGTGSDVALALAHGASHVDAVEIDPSIQQLGATLHPDLPYADPRVSVHIDDGRAFLRNSTDDYDLIIFASTDSLTLVSTAANVRLESFLLTTEGLASARDHLTSSGVFILYDYYREPWLLVKLESMLRSSFGTAPLFRTYLNTYAALADGPAVSDLAVGEIDSATLTTVPTVGDPAPQQATDDWPFLYLRAAAVGPYYVAALAFVLAFAFAMVRLAGAVAGVSLARFSPHFFALGAAFLLLETRSLVTFSLLFGTTWVVNALTFFAILVSVLLAILVNARRPIRRPALLYAALFLALAFAYLLPPEALLIDPPWVRYLLVSSITFAPVFIANLVFTLSFRDTKTADTAFASNLLGAVLGGCLEYMALVTGYRTLLLVVLVLYGVAALFATKVRLLADRDLIRAFWSA